MTACEIQPPIMRLTCDHDGCEETFIAEDGYDRRTTRATRIRAQEADWDVPPARGTGARRPTDFCPAHNSTC